MRLDPRAFGFAAGIVAAVLFSLCALAVWLAPQTTTAMFGYLIHLDLSGISRTLPLGSFVGGLICWALGTGLTLAVGAALYNRLAPGAPAPR